MVAAYVLLALAVVLCAMFIYATSRFEELPEDYGRVVNIPLIYPERKRDKVKS